MNQSLFDKGDAPRPSPGDVAASQARIIHKYFHGVAFGKKYAEISAGETFSLNEHEPPPFPQLKNGDTDGAYPDFGGMTAGVPRAMAAMCR
jgi:hypothetical protein